MPRIYVKIDREWIPEDYCKDCFEHQEIIPEQRETGADCEPINGMEYHCEDCDDILHSSNYYV